MVLVRGEQETSLESFSISQSPPELSRLLLMDVGGVSNEVNGAHEAVCRDDHHNIRPALFNFSCATYVVPPEPTNEPRRYQFYIFFNLEIDHSFVAQRSGVYCILCENLTTVLYQRLVTCDPKVEKIPTDLVNILTGWVKGETQDVELATNRVPSPSKDPSRGYRNLATLSLIGQLIPPPVNTDNNRELFALHRNSETTEYAATYEPSGLNLETHFILIFNLQSISPSPSLGPNPLTPFSRNDINSWAWDAVDFSPIPSPTSSTSQSPTTSAITPSQSVSVTALSTTLSGVSRRQSPLGVNVPTTSNYPPYLHEADEAMNMLFSTEDANTPCVVETYNSDGIDHGTYWQYPDGNAIATGNPIPQVVVESAIMDDVELDLPRSDENATTAANLMPGVVVEPAITGFTGIMGDHAREEEVEDVGVGIPQ